jgi:hypothetical protein
MLFQGDMELVLLLILTERPAKGRISPLRRMRGELAQWLEQRNHNPLVPSSNLGFATKVLWLGTGKVFSPLLPYCYFARPPKEI